MFKTLSILVFIMACITDPKPILVPLAPQEPKTAQEWAVATGLIQKADGIVVGTIAELTPDWTYDDPCGLISKILHRCDGTVAYVLKIQPSGMYLWTFTHPDTKFGLFVGEQAVFVYTVIPITRYKECKEHAAMTSALCASDIIPTLTDDLNVLPLEDSTKVQEIFERRPQY